MRNGFLSSAGRLNSMGRRIILGLALTATCACVAGAAQITYTIDPSLSEISAGGTLLGVSLEQQVAISAADPPNVQSVTYYGFTANYAGSIIASRNWTAN